MKRAAWRQARYRIACLALAVLAVGTTAFLVVRSGGDRAAETKAIRSASSPTLEQRFAVLSRASSNQCGLLSSSLSKLARGGRLQGSCCSRMDFHRYQEQVAGLRRYAGVAEIPRDPYDVPVALAKRLISYDESIELSDAQQATYDRAMKLSEEGGPCCCRCWRWTAFGGQAKFLITRRGWGAQQIAELWQLQDGCGGAGHAEHDSPTS